MKRYAMLAAAVTFPLLLAACGGGGGDAAEEQKLKDAFAPLATTEGTPAVLVKGRNVAVSYAARPAGFAAIVREAALTANKAIGGKQITVYIVDSPTAATDIPKQGQFYCSITANDGRMAGNNC